MSPRRSAATWGAYVALAAVLASAGWYLWTEHQQHVPAILLYGLALACPLLHLRGHGRHGEHKQHEPPGVSSRGE